MRRLHMSTGAWIFASVVAASVIAPTAVYAAVSSTVAIGDAGTNYTATVTSQHQLLVATMAPKQVIHAVAEARGYSCTPIYVPPAGKAVVVTSITYNMAGGNVYGYLEDASCTTNSYDAAGTAQYYDSQSRSFPTGLPMPSVGVSSGGPQLDVFITGYLIPASQLPAASAHGSGLQVPRRP